MTMYFTTSHGETTYIQFDKVWLKDIDFYGLWLGL